jgi:alkylation response protein AidB-like acyl-CoA dehydrogenase
VLRLDDDLDAFRLQIRARAEERIAPLISEIDRAQAFSREVWDQLRAADVFGLSFPTEVGGSGGSFLAFVVANEELARVGAIAAVYPGTTVQVAQAICDHGTAQQIERWVPRLISGEDIASWAFTEPQTGSDPRQLETRATPSGEGWVLHGQKQFISFARQATVALVFARTPDDRVGAFLVETSDEGWQPGAGSEVLGLGGTEAVAVHLDGVSVSNDRVLGPTDGGFAVMLAGEARGKIRAAATCLGIAQRALEEAARYASERTHRGEAIGDKFPSIQVLLGEMGSQVLGTRAFVRAVAVLVDDGVWVMLLCQAAS